MDARDICAIGDALAEGLDGTTRRVEEIHEAVAKRSFAAAGPASAIPEAIHDRITRRLYATVRTVGPAAIRSSALGLGSAIDPSATRAQSSPRGRAVVSAANAVIGDSLARRGNGLSLRMALRADGAALPTTEEGLAAALPAATGRIVVFVHGFGESDDSWGWFSQANWDQRGISYGELMRREAGFTPLYLHYNTGRGVGVNATELSQLLEAVTTNWPVWVDQVVLVGHSAGAWVVRRAVRHGILSSASWVGRLSHVFALGTPLAAQAADRWAGSASRLLGRLPETRPLAQMLANRSAGLRDLSELGTDVELPEHVTTVDLPLEGMKVGHFKLLNHPAVYAEIKARVSDRIVPARAPIVREARYARAATAVRERKRFRRR